MYLDYFVSDLSGRSRGGEAHPLLGRRMPDLDLVTANGPLRVFTLLHDARPVLLNPGWRAVRRGWSRRSSRPIGRPRSRWKPTTPCHCMGRTGTSTPPAAPPLSGRVVTAMTRPPSTFWAALFQYADLRREWSGCRRTSAG
jgi:hypothetical protein